MITIKSKKKAHVFFDENKDKKKKKTKNIWFACYTRNKATWNNKDYIL